MSIAQRRRRFAAAVVDSLAWVLGVFAAVALRFEYQPTLAGWTATLVLALAAAGVQVIVGYFFGFYRGRYTYGSFEEVRMLGLAVLLQAAVLSVLTMAFGSFVGVPRGTVILAFPFVLLMMFGVRYLARLMLERTRKPGEQAKPESLCRAAQ